MKEIEKYRCSAGLLKKTVTNDRSKPILSKSKVKGVVSIVLYESASLNKYTEVTKKNMR